MGFRIDPNNFSIIVIFTFLKGLGYNYNSFQIKYL